MAAKTANAMYVLKRYRTSDISAGGFHPPLFSQILSCYRSTGIPKSIQVVEFRY
jgi:hypothetical protein